MKSEILLLGTEAGMRLVAWEMSESQLRPSPLPQQFLQDGGIRVLPLPLSPEMEEDANPENWLVKKKKKNSPETDILRHPLQQNGKAINMQLQSICT